MHRPLLLAALLLAVHPAGPPGTLARGSLAAQERCPRAAGPDAEAGWEAYRVGDLPRARARFAAALALCPRDPYASTGLGYVALREGARSEADSLFAAALSADPDDTDALVGAGILAWWEGDRAGAEARFRRVAELSPGHPTATEYLERLADLVRDSAAAAARPSDPADAAWRAGDTERALGLYLARLETDPSDGVALHRAALARAWAGRYGPALELFRRLAEAEPGNLEARVDRARVLAWSGDLGGASEELDRILALHPGFAPALEARAAVQSWGGGWDESLSTLDELLAGGAEAARVRLLRAATLSAATQHVQARAAFDSVLVADPGNREALLGLGRVLTLAGDLEGAERAFGSVLTQDPGNGEALAGLGRALTWRGRLVEGEASIRRAVAAEPGNVGHRVGLAQNLRWQGRTAAAHAELAAAARLDPSDGDVREQRRWVDALLAPQLRPSFVVEADAEENRMATSAVAASFHPVPRLTLRADAYRRDLEAGAFSRWSRGVSVSAGWQAEPGWSLSAGVGGSRSNGTRSPSTTSWSASVSSPGRYPLSATVAASSSALDVTAPLAERGVRVTEAALTARWAPGPRWAVDGSLVSGSYRGEEDNRRTAAALSAARRLGRVWTLGAGARAFGFEKDLLEGYFDPGFFGLAEVTARWMHEPGRWSFVAELAPAVQRVGGDGDLQGAVRAAARVGFRFGPGREVVVSGGYSSTGLQSFATGSSGYWYRALGVGGGWVF